MQVIPSFTWLLKFAFILKLCLSHHSLNKFFFSSETLNAIIVGYKSFLMCNMVIFFYVALKYIIFSLMFALFP